MLVFMFTIKRLYLCVCVCLLIVNEWTALNTVHVLDVFH